MAKPVVVDIPHNLTRQEAKQRIENGFGRIREQIAGKTVACEERWEGERLLFDAAAFGQSVSGRIDILEHSVRMEVDLPWILASIAEKLQGKLKKEGTLLLAKK